MKKYLSAFLLAIIFTLSGCAGGLGGSSSEDSSFDSVTSEETSDSSEEHTHVDDDENGYCDVCELIMHEHADSNDDDTCDVCQAATAITLDLYSINDIHGKFEDTYANIGVDEMSTYLRRAKTENENTILLSAGDTWQGGAASYFTKGEIFTEWMNDMGFAAMALGNHEFDWGESYIEQNAELAEFPLLGINVYDKTTDKRKDYCQPSVVVETSGVKIGIIGAIGDCLSSIAAEQVENVYFKTDDELTELVKAESTRLREDMGVAAVVYLLHDAEVSNANYYDLELSDGYVDVVFEGHSHTKVQKQDAHGVWHLQAYGDNSKGVSHAKLKINILDETVSTEQAHIIYHDAYSGMQDDPIVNTLLQKYESELEIPNEVLGYNNLYRNSNALASAAAQAMYTAGEERWGSDPKYAGKIVCGGGFINVRSPYYLPEGEVKYGDIYSLFMFDNPVILCSVSGYRLQKQFYDSTNYVCYYGAYGESLRDNVDINETYYVVVDTYCANYNFKNMGYMTIVEYYDEDHSVFNRDLLAEYIREGGFGAPKPTPTPDPTPDPDPTPADPTVLTKTIPEILEIGEGLANGAETAQKYRVEGVIASITTQEWGNMYIRDTDGNELYVYGVYSASGGKFHTITNPPIVGDRVVLEGTVKKYDNVIEFFKATLIQKGGSGTQTGASTLALSNGFGGSEIGKYDTGNYGSYTVNGAALEYYRAYKPSGADYILQLLPCFSSNDGSEGGALFNSAPIYGIQSVSITYKCSAAAMLYTGDDRVASMTAYPLPATNGYSTVTYTVSTDNFFKLESEVSALYIQSFSLSYTGQAVSYNSGKINAGTGYTRLNATAFVGTLVAGQSAVAVPSKVVYDGGSCQVQQTKTYTYYTWEYVRANPSVAANAAMTSPTDIAAYYAAFEKIPANFAGKTENLNYLPSFYQVSVVFGDDTRYVSQYSRDDGYVTAVPYDTAKTLVYYEFDVAVDSTYGKNSRGVGRVVTWINGWNASGYDDAPVSAFTDDHYATFQEWLNVVGQFGKRFDAEKALNNVQWSAPTTATK